MCSARAANCRTVQVKPKQGQLQPLYRVFPHRPGFRIDALPIIILVVAGMGSSYRRPPAIFVGKRQPGSTFPKPAANRVRQHFCHNSF